MQAEVKAVMQECTQGSDEGRLTFPEVVMKLRAAGVEQYHADLRRGEKTYYLPSGESLVVPAAAIETKPAQDFSAGGVDAALRAIQAKAITYKDFCERIAAAGCVGYCVYITGRRAIYLGRSGDYHVEPFPVAAP